MTDRPVKHSVTLKGHRTSISLEPEFWQALREMAGERDMALNALVAEIDVARGTSCGLASAIRLHVLRNLRARLPRDV
ncbi:ribbon-helix-helix domain-containing protein [Sulfitobacter sp. LCG007]